MSQTNLKPVRSSNVHSVGYDKESKTLTVRFHGGATYHHHGVPADEHEALMGADSVGGHYNARIRSGGYKTTKA